LDSSDPQFFDELILEGKSYFWLPACDTPISGQYQLLATRSSPAMLRVIDLTVFSFSSEPGNSIQQLRCRALDPECFGPKSGFLLGPFSLFPLVRYEAFRFARSIVWKHSTLLFAFASETPATYRDKHLR